MKDVLVVIPTYNEADSIGWICKVLRTYDVLVVDGGDDETPDVVRASNKECERFPCNIGAAVRHGLDRACKRGYKWVVVMDAGGSHNPATVFQLVHEAKDLDVDVVIASRFINGAPYRGFRTLLSRVATAMYQWIGVNVTDITTSFRCYKVSMLSTVLWGTLWRGDWFETQPEILTHLVRAGATVAEVPAFYQLTGSRFRLKFVWLGFKMWWRLARDGWRWQASCKGY